MKLTIKKLIIKNFRNITDLELNFNEIYNEISAQNGTGKTNTLSAITWCLFGKNIYELKQFTISPIVDGTELKTLETNVKLYLNDNYIISRAYKNKKTTLKTGYLIDGEEQLSEITQSNYLKEFEENFVNEETYKSLSNINYMPNLNWKDLKELIFSLIGGVTDNEVLLRDNFNLVEEQINLMGIEKTTQSLNDNDSQLANEIKTIETELQTMLSTKNKYVTDKQETETLEQQKKNLEEELKTQQDIVQMNLENNEHRSRVKEEIRKNETIIEQKKSLIEYNKGTIEECEKMYEQLGASADIMREKERLYILEKLNMVESRMKQLSAQSEEFRSTSEKIKLEGNALKEKEVKIENNKCSSCGQELPKEIIEKTLEKLREEKQHMLDNLLSKYKEMKKIIDCNNKEIEKLLVEQAKLNKELSEIKDKKYKVEKETEQQKNVRERKKQKITEISKLEKEIKHAETTLKQLNKENSIIPQTIELTKNTIDIYEELKGVNEKLSISNSLKGLEEDIKRKNEELSDRKTKRNLLNEKIAQIKKFNSIKAELIRDKAKAHFKLVDFITREFNNDGTEKETFKICYNGIEFNELNTGMKTLVSIDLVQGIQKLKDTYLPILIDNFENVTSSLSVDNTQLIVCKSVKGISKIEVSNEIR